MTRAKHLALNSLQERHLLQKRSHQKRKQQNGFTLLEIIVVVFIIGLMAGVLVFRLGDDASRKVLFEANRFIQVVNEVQDLSALSGKPYALAFDLANKSYDFRENPPEWTLVSDDALFKVRQFPEQVSISVDIERIDNSSNDIVNDTSNELSDTSSGIVSIDEDAEKAIDISPKNNHVLISPFEGVNPFTLTLSGENVQLLIKLSEEQRLEAIRQ